MAVTRSLSLLSSLARAPFAHLEGGAMATLRSSCPSLLPSLGIETIRPASRSTHHLTLIVRAIGDDEELASTASEDEDDFEERLAKIRRKVTTGKKAEKRKALKQGIDFPSSSASSSSSSSSSLSSNIVLLPPVPLLDPIADGLKVELGFNPYTERLNGRLAALGLAAVLLIELATGKSFLKYHDPATIGLQIYFILGAAALYIKYQKEKKSIWPPL